MKPEWKHLKLKKQVHMLNDNIADQQATIEKQEKKITSLKSYS